MLLDWEVTRLRSGVRNPTSVGLYRVSGHAIDGGSRLSWSCVLKVVQSRVNAGWRDAGDDPRHWNYWRRQIETYRSGLLARLPGRIVAPAHYVLALAEEATDRARHR